jgi:hypothetical protein
MADKDDARREELLKKLDDDPMLLVEAYLQSEIQNRAAEYVSRGRRFSSATADELTDEVARYFRGWLAGPANPEKFRAYDDACSELRLRGHEPPLPTREVLERILRHARTLRRDDRVQEAVGDSIKQLRRTLTDPKQKG